MQYCKARVVNDKVLVAVCADIIRMKGTIQRRSVGQRTLTFTLPTDVSIDVFQNDPRVIRAWQVPNGHSDFDD